MEHISISTAEQEKGIQQIAIALSELEKVTQSNIFVAEELASSADVMNNQVAGLQKKPAICDWKDMMNTTLPRDKTHDTRLIYPY